MVETKHRRMYVVTDGVWERVLWGDEAELAQAYANQGFVVMQYGYFARLHSNEDTK